MRKALVLFSGGQDSTTCLYWAKRQFDLVEAIAFDYGQRHRIELTQAKKIAAIAETPLAVIDARGLLGDSALTDLDRDVTAAHPRAAGLPGSFVPGRNLLFLSIAASCAFSRDIGDLVGGMCETDFSGYPDCRRIFIDSLEQTLGLAMDRTFQIHTPLMKIDKADTFKMAEDLGILDLVLEYTHTDYNGDRTERHPWGYGKLDNEASRLRARGYDEFRRRYHSA